MGHAYGFDWKDNIGLIKEWIEGGMSQRKIADQLGIGRKAVREGLERLNLKTKFQAGGCDTKRNEGGNKSGEITELYKSKFPDGHGSFEEALKVMGELKQVDQAFRLEEYQIEKTIPSKKPIALTFLSDLHIGNPATDYESLLRDLKLIKENPSLYMAAGGDWEDNFLPGFRSAEAVVDQITKPQNQFLISEMIYKELGPKIIAKGPGNHDIREEAKTGVSPTFFIIKGKKIPWMKHGGLLKLTIGNTEYKILWKHKWRYNSSLNLFNAHRRMLETLYPLADMVVMEHQHNPGMEKTHKYEFDMAGEKVFIRTGTYLRGDAYSREFFKDGIGGPQTVILYPDKKKIVPFDGNDAILDAQIYLNGIN